MDGYQFEYQCAEILKRNGFSRVQVTQSSGDQGVDIIARKHRKKYGIQCKYYSHPVGNKAIQEAYAGADFYDCDAAMVMTNNTFTRAARELAEKLEVELWEYCSPNGNSPFVTRLMRIFNVFFLLTGVVMSISVSLLDFPQNTLTNYMAFLMLILAALSGLIGWNHFLPCILSGMLYFGFFLAFVLPLILLSDSNWYGILMLLPTLITVVHALYARFRNREPVQ